MEFTSTSSTKQTPSAVKFPRASCSKRTIAKKLVKWIVDVLTQGKGRKTKKIIGKLKLSFGWRHGKKKKTYKKYTEK